MKKKCFCVIKDVDCKKCRSYGDLTKVIPKEYTEVISVNLKKDK